MLQSLKMIAHGFFVVDYHKVYVIAASTFCEKAIFCRLKK